MVCYCSRRSTLSLSFKRRNLDETTRTVYKENISLSEQLSEFMKEEEVLKRLNNKLREENSLLVAESENSEALLKEKRTDSQRKCTQLAEVGWLS